MRTYLNNIVFYFFLVFGLCMSFYYFKHQILTGDQTQMLYKGYLAARSNIWLNYGNGASAMGNVPGSLSTLLIALPLKVLDSPYSPVLLLLTIRLIGFFLFDSVIKEIFSPSIRFLFLLLCWFNPWFQFESLLYNPSYLFFCSALHFWSAYHSLRKPSFAYSFLHILSIGLALQLHYSWPLLALITIFLFFKKNIFANWSGVFCASLIIIGSLIPYIHDVRLNPALLTHQDPEANARYIGWGGLHIYPVLKSILYWLRYASLLFPNKILTSADFNWLTDHKTLQSILLYLWRGVTFTIGGVTVLFAVIANYSCWKKIKTNIAINSNQLINAEDWLIYYSIGAIFAVIISATLSPIVLIYWHLMLVFPFALFPLLIFVNQKKDVLFKTPLIFWLIAYFILINVIASNDSTKYSYESDYYQQTLTFLEQQKL